MTPSPESSISAIAGSSVAFRARDGSIVALKTPANLPAAGDLREVPARSKPKRLKIVTGASVDERLKAATEMQAGRGQLLVDTPPEEAARVIFEYLCKEGILSVPSLVPPGTKG